MFMNALHDRVRGVLYGLAAGDRNGGPIAMALCLGESLVSSYGYDAEDVLQRYLSWWKTEGYDTGPVTAYVFVRTLQGVPHKTAVYQVHELMDGQTAGCNPAHRIAPIAMAAFIEDSRLAEVVHAEASLTHWDPLAGDVAASVVQICRYLIHGKDWFSTVERVLPAPIYRTLMESPQNLINRGGFAPDVLYAAIHFVSKHTSFREALLDSIRFAGQANYAPVLVGVFGGARWGRSAISDDLLQHCKSGQQIEEIATTLACAWY
jgi:ADP-ribosylglycohydrolase